MEQENQPQRGFKRKPTHAETVKCIIFCVLALLFTLWVGDFWPLIFVVLIVDCYYTKFIPWTWWKNLKNSFLRSVMSWVDAIVFALVAIYILQNFFVQNFQIPSTSLEKTMLAGDYLLVSKAQYGPRIPMTPLSLPLYQHTITVPFTGAELGKSYLEQPQVPYRRMNGLSNVERFDIVVFNYPAGDTVATLHQNDDYYRLRFHYGVQEMHANKRMFGDIIYRPVDRRENYVKRCIGLPGDTLQIIDNKVFINDAQIADPQYLQFRYFIETQGLPISSVIWKRLGVYTEDYQEETDRAIKEFLGMKADSTTGAYAPLYSALLTQEMIDELKKSKNVVRISPYPSELWGKDYVYPYSHTNPWTHTNYGPIWIPKAGASIALTPENVALYERCIVNYEGNTLTQRPDGTYLLNGTPSTTYTFGMDYYWMMGDNRDNSADSRYWGFVPEDHVVGTPLFVWFSINKETGEFRWDRLFKKVKGL